MKTINNLKTKIRDNLSSGKPLHVQINEIRHNPNMEAWIKDELLSWLEQSPCAEKSLVEFGEVKASEL